jgi:hypothetical protein
MQKNETLPVPTFEDQIDLLLSISFSAQYLRNLLEQTLHNVQERICLIN